MTPPSSRGSWLLRHVDGLLLGVLVALVLFPTVRSGLALAGGLLAGITIGRELSVRAVVGWTKAYEIEMRRLRAVNRRLVERARERAGK